MMIFVYMMKTEKRIIVSVCRRSIKMNKSERYKKVYKDLTNKIEERHSGKKTNYTELY